jgi:transcriptional regulator with AAA-type ATPase domain/tetratricopeptide (TPR) repeat protein
MPVPQISGAVGYIPKRDLKLIREVRLSRRDRFRAALQLTAGIAHLAEFDLWPGRDALSLARLERTSGGLSVTMGRFPYPLSVAIERLGGGEGAMERLRTAAVQRIAGAVGLAPEDIDGPHEGPGLVFESAITRQLRELEQPVDPLTARSLWALRWNELPAAESGVVQLWRVSRDEAARRLASALWCRLRRERCSAWLWSAGDATADTAPMPSLGERGTLIVVGSLSQGELNALNRWSRREDCSAVAIGTFPSGWQAPSPGIDSERLIRHISLVGISPDRARRILEQRRSRFDPVQGADLDALTTAVCSAASPKGRSYQPARRHPVDEVLTSWLALSPTGLPANIVALHSGIAISDLEAIRERLGVISDSGTWRLPEPGLLNLDPRHLLVAGIISIDQPLHLVHSALGTGDSSRLEAWARGELDRLNAIQVRELLSLVAPGALGHPVQLLEAEACLSVNDLCGARRALKGVPAGPASAHMRWLEAIDHPPGKPRSLPTDAEIRSYARVAAETAVIVLHDAHRRGLEQKRAAAEVVDAALKHLQGESRRRIEIELAYIEQSPLLADTGWGREMTGDAPALRVQLAHRRAMIHLDYGRLKSARRLFEVLSTAVIGPGLLGVVELDLGAVALQQGRSRDAAAHHLRAYRWMRAAGFEHLTNAALFNLAVADIDQLRVHSAEERLRLLAASDPSDGFVTGERARLALAVGDEPSFRRLLAAFEEAVRDDDPRFAEGLALLRGAASVLEGDHTRAVEMLEKAGQEGLAWLALAATDGGREVPGDLHDEWGVGRAAAILRVVRMGRDPDLAIPSEKSGPADGLAIALAERINGVRLALDAQTRGAAIRALRSAGLTGWAEKLSAIQEHAAGLMTALARIVESGGVDGVEVQQLELLVRSLEITGIEVLDVGERKPIWRYGSGRSGSELRHGRLTVRPLGGDLVDGPASRLVLGILDLVLPLEPCHDDSDVEETGFYGVSKAARSLRRELLELGPSHLPILLVGETGVGKEVAARALHRISGRPGALVTVNVAAIPGSLLEAELFGSVKGAFTGADRSRRGLAVAADGGTLFLDEVGDLDGDLQVKLLRFLESGEVRPVGASQSRQVDVRIVSATHADLGTRMREGDFRRDLYFRIAAPEVEVEPLRNRREDVALLRDVFEREAVSRYGLKRPVWSAEADAALQRYHWPGNVRELRHVVEVAMVRAAGSVVQCDHLPISTPELMPGGTWDQAQHDFRRRFLSAALHRNQGNRSATARELGISRQALLYHLRSLGLNKSSKA